MSEPEVAREEWEDGTLGKCAMCGEERIVRWNVDPFLQEMHPDDPGASEESPWCRQCYQQQIDDI